jgi:hypothetical protein
MVTLFSRFVEIEYSVLLINGSHSSVNFHAEGFVGQKNGLLGVSVADAIVLRFGMAAGDIHTHIMLADFAPDLESKWEEVVEASWSYSGEHELMLCEGTPADRVEKIPLSAGTYRLRFCIMNCGLEGSRWVNAALQKTPLGPPEPPESCELVLWPAPFAPEAILKVTQPVARAWHSDVEKQCWDASLY